MTYKRHYDGKVHLLKTKMTEACLGASLNEKLTSKDLKRGLFSPCGWDANQVTSSLIFQSHSLVHDAEEVPRLIL